jgi:hypothetical protein
MINSRRATAVVTGMIALAATASLSPARALEQVQIGQIYIMHTAPADTCSALDWHFVVDAHRSVIGFLTCDWDKHLATLSGTLGEDDTFQITVSELGGTGKADATGKFTSRFVTLSVDAPGSPCDKHTFQIAVVRGGSSGGDGG